MKAFTEALQHELRNTPNCKVNAHLLILGFVFTPLTSKGRSEKPAGRVDAGLRSSARAEALARCKILSTLSQKIDAADADALTRQRQLAAALPLCLLSKTCRTVASSDSRTADAAPRMALQLNGAFSLIAYVRSRRSAAMPISIGSPCGEWLVRTCEHEAQD